MNDDLRTFQHLLRNLNNFPALRKNALVASLRVRSGLTGQALHARVRAIVTQHLDMLAQLHSIDRDVDRAKRWRAIVERCDLNGEAHEAVADSLGLSRAQFYRERRAAQESLAETLLRAFETPLEATLTVPSETEMQIEFAAALRTRGRAEETLALLEQAATSPDLRQRLAAFTELALSHDQLGHASELRSLLATARTLCYSTDNTDPAIEAELQMIEALVARIDGKMEEYLAALQRAQHRLTRSDVVYDRRAHDLTFAVSLELVDQHLNSGNPSQARSHLSLIQSLFDRQNTVRPEHRIEHLVWNGELSLFDGNVVRAVRLFEEALALSRDNGLLRHAIYISAALATSCQHGGRSNAAQKHAQNALRLSHCLPEKDVARMSSGLANIEFHADRPHHALAAAREADAWLRQSRSAQRFLNDLIIAGSLGRTGYIDEALHLVEATREEVTRRQEYRLVGYAEEIRSEIYDRIGRHAEARNAIDNAVRILERHGTMYAFGHACELSARITRNATHRKRAREIRAQLAL
jgi:tetratricopeptide (TPR) repeat protein